MSKKLYVGNLSYNTNNDDLEKLFSEFGAVASVNLIEDRDSGRSKGFAFVEMETSDAASEAINSLDGKEVDGRNLKVNAAKPKEKRENNYNSRY